MGWLTFISKIWDAAAWPVVFVIGFVLFRDPITKLILKLKSLQFKGLEMETELPAPKETSEQDIEIIVFFLRRSPHSFQWFRDNTEIQYTDEEFRTLVATHSKILEPVNIVSSDKEKRKGTSGKTVDQMIDERTENNEKEQLTMDLEIEFRDELGNIRRLPPRKHFFRFISDEFRWVPILAVRGDWTY